jgi:uncharacterized protein (TIGR02757 family)
MEHNCPTASQNHEFLSLPDHFQEIKIFLDQKVAFYNSPAFINDDPVSIPHMFAKKEDIEISGFLAAMLAWGKRKTIIQSTKKLINLMDNSPHDFILNFIETDLKQFGKFVHRTFNGDDCLFFLWSLQNIYHTHGGLEGVFANGDKKPDEVVFHAILNFRKIFLETEHLPRSEKHIANPEKNASAKRLNMFLRWMVRNDNRGFDFGIWKSIKKEHLICPLDVHSGNSARKLGLLNRKANDWMAAFELTKTLRLLAPDDPVKYDFALFGLGAYESKNVNY